MSSRNLAQLTNGSISRRHFIMGGGALLGASALGTLNGCASLPRQSIKNPGQALYDFDKHDRAPRGIDFQYDGGPNALVVAPTWGWVMFPKEKADGDYGVSIETPRGQWVAMGSFENTFVQPNDWVTPGTIIGIEGRRGPHATKHHTHTDVRVDPDIFSEGIKYVEPNNNVLYNLHNPHSYSKTGNLFSSLYQGETRTLDGITRDDEAKLDAVERKHPMEHVSLLMRVAKEEDIRFFARVQMLRKALKYGLIEDPEMAQDVRDFFKWYGTRKVDMSLIYQTPGVVYHHPQDNSERTRTIRALDQEISKYPQPHQVRERIGPTRERVKLSPVWHEIGNLLSMGGYWGAVHGDPMRTIAHLLAADGIAGYKWSQSVSDKNTFYPQIYNNLQWAYKKLGKLQHSQTFSQELDRYKKAA